MTDTEKLALIDRMIADYSEYWGDMEKASDVVISMIECVVEFGGDGDAAD